MTEHDDELFIEGRWADFWWIPILALAAIGIAWWVVAVVTGLGWV